MKKTLSVALLLFAVFPFQSLHAQDSLKTGYNDAEIRLEAFVDKTECPLNRPVLLTIRLTWSGDQDRFKVHPFDNPILHNLEITGNATANRVGAVNGTVSSVEEHQFTLKPTNLGMAYVEGLIITYTDLETDKEYSLTTNRLEVEIVDPLPEPGSKMWMVWLALILVIVVAAVYVGIALKKKKEVAKKQAELEAAAAIPLEEKYLAQLKEAVNFNDPALDTGEAINRISKIVRHFLHEKFTVSGLEATTSEVLDELESLDPDQRFMNEIREVLTRADTIKYTGGHTDRAELERFYTLTESNLQRSLRGELISDGDIEQEKD